MSIHMSVHFLKREVLSTRLDNMMPLCLCATLFYDVHICMYMNMGISLFTILRGGIVKENKKLKKQRTRKKSVLE